MENPAGENWAEFQRSNKMYKVKKYDSEGSGQYVIYTLHIVDANNQLSQLGEFTTCGKYQLSKGEIKFFGPKEFHCGNFSHLTDLIDPQVSTFSF